MLVPKMESEFAGKETMEIAFSLSNTFQVRLVVHSTLSAVDADLKGEHDDVQD